MNKDVKNLLIFGGVSVGAYYLYKSLKSSNSAENSGVTQSSFSNFMNQQGSVQVLSQITSGYNQFITQYASPTTDQYGKRWYLYVFSNAPQQFVGNYPTPSSNSSLQTTSLLKTPACTQFINKANQISLQYPNYAPFSVYLQALLQMPTNPCAREWWFKNMFGSEWVAPKVTATYTNEASIGTAIAQLKTYVANTYPSYRIAIIRQ
jgi:hypothetical protein